MDRAIYEKTGDEIAALIGDTNIFVHKLDELKAGEIEIMIAEEKSRGKKRGWEATLLMLNYGIEVLGIQKYIAITKYHNDKSISMFKKMQFEEIKRVIVFKEV